MQSQILNPRFSLVSFHSSFIITNWKSRLFDESSAVPQRSESGVTALVLGKASQYVVVTKKLTVY